LADLDRADCWAALAQDDQSLMVAQTDDSLRVADDCQADSVVDDCQADSVVDDCQADSVVDDYSAASDCPAEAGSPQDCSCPGVRSLRADFPLVDSPLADFRAERSSDYPYDFQPRAVAAAWLAEQ
jgi:hypothetical protein